MKLTKLTALALVIGATTGLATTSHAESFSYAVRVKTNFGTKFNDCFTFDKGKLTFAGISIPFTAAPTMPKYFYTAVSSPKVSAEIGIGIAFSGYKVGNNMSGKLHAVGANSIHNSYTVEGVSTPSCSSAETSAPGGLAAYISQ